MIMVRFDGEKGRLFESEVCFGSRGGGCGEFGLWCQCQPMNPIQTGSLSHNSRIQKDPVYLVDACKIDVPPMDQGQRNPTGLNSPLTLAELCRRRHRHEGVMT